MEWIILLAIAGFVSSAAPSTAISCPRGIELSVHQVDGDAARTPPPTPGDWKARSSDGHAYWLSRAPILNHDVTGVRVEDGDRTQRVILRLNSDGRSRLASYTARNVHRQVAYVMNAQIAGRPVTIQEPIDSGEIVFLASADPSEIQKALARLSGACTDQSGVLQAARIKFRADR